jgi:DNA-binding MarR family transcriptional regulator
MGEKSQKGVGRALVLASRLHRARLGERLQESGLFPGQDIVLETLAAHGQMPIGELAERLDVRPPTISKTVTRLSAQGLLSRGPGSGSDARTVLVALTQAGEEKVTALAGLGAAVEKEMLAGLDAKDRKRLRKALKRMSRNLAAASGRTTSADGEDAEDEQEG